MACMTATMTRIGGMTVRMGLVCGSNLGQYDVLWVQDGALETADGAYLCVPKKKRNKNRR